MNTGPSFWGEVHDLFLATVALEPAERALFLDTRCRDPRIRAEVESLLASHEPDDPFLEKSVWDYIEAAEGERLTGARIGGYRVVRPLGAGGMGTVFLAVKEGDGYEQRVALKLVRGGELLVQRFRQERQILAGLEHPGIARLLDGGATPDGLPFLVVEYVEGAPIDEFAAQLGLTAKLELFLQLCEAVAYAHRNLVIHRDIKPANVLVTADMSPKLLDFGIAKLLSNDDRSDATVTRLMTPGYASPEQLLGKPVTTATDVYSLGVLLFEILTGSRLFEGSVRAPASEAPSAGSRLRMLRGDLDIILATALEVDPARRYPSVERFADDVRRHLAGHPVLARRPTFAYRASKFVRRNRVGVAAAAVVTAVTIGAFATTLHQKRIAEQRFEQVRSLAHAVVFELHDAIATLPGSTAARELLVRRALGYLDTLAAEAGENRPLQLELARAYLKIGDVQGLPYSPNLGDTTGAIRSYQKALELATRLHRSGDEATLALRADLHDRIGLVQQRAFRWREALENHQRSLALRETLPLTPGRQLALARTWTAIGDCYYVGRVALFPSEVRPPEPAYEKALRVLAGVKADQAGQTAWLVETARAHQRLGGYASGPDAKDLPRAIRHHDAALQALRRCVELQPANATLRRNWADQIVMKATAQNRAADYAGALRGTSEALEVLRDLERADPGNAEARRDVSFAMQEMSRALLGLGKIREARRAAMQALNIHREIAAANPANEEDRRSVVTIYGVLRDIAVAAGSPSETERWQ